jgi:four helix bundle protein
MRQDKIEDNVILKLSFEFALEIIAYSELLDTNRKYIISKQLLKSGTSIGANVREAQNSESKADFIHKFKIAAKEADETQYWLQLCKFSKNYPDCEHLIKRVEELNRIITKIISTSKRQ